eukprot:3894528-Rhodomonas_salina.7
MMRAMTEVMSMTAMMMTRAMMMMTIMMMTMMMTMMMMMFRLIRKMSMTAMLIIWGDAYDAVGFVGSRKKELEAAEEEARLPTRSVFTRAMRGPILKLQMVLQGSSSSQGKAEQGRPGQLRYLPTHLVCHVRYSHVKSLML